MQYGFNTASVLIQPTANTILSTQAPFQYSFCSYSTRVTWEKLRDVYRFNTASVLIQHIALFLSVVFLGFNTASVLIQR